MHWECYCKSCEDIDAFDKLSKSLTKRYELTRDHTLEREDPAAKKLRSSDAIISSLPLSGPSEATGCMSNSILKKLDEKRQEAAEVEEALLEEAKLLAEDHAKKAKEKQDKSKAEAHSQTKSKPLLKIQLGNHIDAVTTRLKNKVATHKASVEVLCNEGAGLLKELNECVCL